MKKSIAAAALAVSLLLSGCSGVSQEDYNSLLEENTRLLEENSELSETGAQLLGSMSSLKEQFDTLTSDYEKLKEDAQPFLELSEAERQAEMERMQKEEAERKAQEEKERLEEEAKGYETGITFQDISRSPDTYKGKKVKFTGTLLQVIEGYSYNEARMSTNGRYDDVIYIRYKTSIIDVRLLKDDEITICGTFSGLRTYETIMGNNVTVPEISVDIISLGDEDIESSQSSENIPANTSYSTLYDDKFVNISFCGVEKHSGKDSIVYLVENKTDMTLNVWDPTVALDGFDLGEMGGSGNVSPQSKGKVYFYLYDSENTNIENKSPSTVSGSLVINDVNSSGKLDGERYRHISFSNVAVK